MNEFLLITALMFAGINMGSLQDNGYIEVGLGYHPAQDMPEANFDNGIAQWEMGVKFNRTKIFYQHTSGIQTTEEGLGLNIIGIKYRIK